MTHRSSALAQMIVSFEPKIVYYCPGWSAFTFLEIVCFRPFGSIAFDRTPLSRSYTLPPNRNINPYERFIIITKPLKQDFITILSNLHLLFPMYFLCFRYIYMFPIEGVSNVCFQSIYCRSKLVLFLAFL